MPYPAGSMTCLRRWVPGVEPKEHYHCGVNESYDQEHD